MTSRNAMLVVASFVGVASTALACIEPPAPSAELPRRGQKAGVLFPPLSPNDVTPSGSVYFEVQFRNEMSDAFQLRRALVDIDERVLYSQEDSSGDLAQETEILAYRGPVPAGRHVLLLELAYQGHGSGLLAYRSGYRFEVKSSHAFVAEEGKALNIVVTAFEKGDPRTPLEQRPMLQWTETAHPLAQDGGVLGASSLATDAGAKGAGETRAPAKDFPL